MTSVTFRRKNKTLEHCFTSMCFFSNTWLRGVTPLNAYTLTQTRTHTHSLVKPRLIVLPGQISLCVETPRGWDTHSRPRLTALHIPSSLLSRAARLAVFISASVEKTHRCVRVGKRKTHTLTSDHVYIDLEQSPGAVQYTSPSPPSLSQSLAFSFSLI